MKDIIFINPPNHVISPYFPMGIAYLDYILKENGIESDIFDLQNKIVNNEIIINKNFFINAKKLLQTQRAKIYAFTMMNSAYPWSIELIKIIKELYPNSVIIVGGSNVTSLMEDVLIDNPQIDIACVYEGEGVIYPLVKAILKGNNENLRHIKNIIFRDSSNTIVYTGEEDILYELDKLPIIDFNISDYKNISVINMDVGRGCPFNCYFCATNHIWQRTPRYKSPKRIVEEAGFYFDKIKSNKHSLISFEHDNFLVEGDCLAKIVKYKKELGIDFDYGCAARIDLVNDEIINLLEASSCKYIFFGIESGSEKIQKIYRKNLILDNILLNIKKIVQKKILVETNYIIGFPEETLEDLLETFRLMAEAKWVNPTYSIINISVMSPEPKSQLAKDTDIEDFVLIESNPDHAMLVEVGFNIQNYNKRAISHIFTIRNKNFDIIEVMNFAYFYLELLTSYPVTLYILNKKYSIDIKDLFNIYLRDFKTLKVNDKIYTKFCKSFEMHLDDIFLNNILKYEELRYSYKKAIQNKQKLNTQVEFDYNIHLIYNSLKFNPSELFNTEYEKCSTSIKL